MQISRLIRWTTLGLCASLLPALAIAKPAGRTMMAQTTTKSAPSTKLASRHSAHKAGSAKHRTAGKTAKARKHHASAMKTKSKKHAARSHRAAKRVNRKSAKR